MCIFLITPLESGSLFFSPRHCPGFRLDVFRPPYRMKTQEAIYYIACRFNDPSLRWPLQQESAWLWLNCTGVGSDSGNISMAARRSSSWGPGALVLLAKKVVS